MRVMNLKIKEFNCEKAGDTSLTLTSNNTFGKH